MKSNRYEMLLDQYRLLEREYNRYSSGEISKEEYLRRAKPIDETIAAMEMATLLSDSFAPYSYLQSYTTIN